MTPEMQKKMDEQNEKLYEEMSPVEKVEYLLALNHHSLESGCDAHVDLFDHALPDLIQGVKSLVAALGLAGRRCEEIHHPKKFQHKSGEKCPAEEFIREALKGWEG